MKCSNKYCQDGIEFIKLVKKNKIRHITINY